MDKQINVSDEKVLCLDLFMGFQQSRVKEQCNIVRLWALKSASVVIVLLMQESRMFMIFLA